LDVRAESEVCDFKVEIEGKTWTVPLLQPPKPGLYIYGGADAAWKSSAFQACRQLQEGDKTFVVYGYPFHESTGHILADLAGASKLVWRVSTDENEVKNSAWWLGANNSIIVPLQEVEASSD
jgi:hypothetical protein